MAHFIIVLLACSNPDLPELNIPSNTLIIRESFQGPGSERTGNWWGRFDQQGCWWEAHNTWLVVTDPVLAKTTAHPAHWNAVEKDQPWFCIQKDMLEELKDIVNELPRGSPGYGYVRALDRWTFVAGDRGESHVVYRGMPHGRWKRLIDFFDELSSVSVWGLSQE